MNNCALIQNAWLSEEWSNSCNISGVQLVGSDDFKAIYNSSEACTKISSKLFALTFMQETNINTICLCMHLAQLNFLEDKYHIFHLWEMFFLSKHWKHLAPSNNMHLDFFFFRCFEKKYDILKQNYIKGSF